MRSCTSGKTLWWRTTKRLTWTKTIRSSSWAECAALRPWENGRSPQLPASLLFVNLKRSKAQLLHRLEKTASRFFFFSLCYTFKHWTLMTYQKVFTSALTVACVLYWKHTHLHLSCNISQIFDLGARRPPSKSPRCRNNPNMQPVKDLMKPSRCWYCYIIRHPCCT